LQNKRKKAKILNLKKKTKKFKKSLRKEEKKMFKT